MAGIIASMLAGGAAGGGEAIAQQGKMWSEKQHQDALNEAQSIRARSLAELQGNIQRRLETEVRQPFQTSERVAGEQSTAEQNRLQRVHSERLQEMLNTRIREEAGLTREQAAEHHRERMRVMEEQFRNTGLSLQATESGIAIINARDKSVTYLKDPADPTKNLMAAKDSTALMGAMAATMKALEGSVDPASHALARNIGNTLMSILNQRLNLPTPQPTDADIQKLKTMKNDPTAVAAFDTKFGTGAAARILQTPAATAPGQPPSATPTQPGGALTPRNVLERMRAPRQPLMEEEEETHLLP